MADDDPAIRTILQFNLEDAGFHVETVENGDDAWWMARRMLPDLIVLDVMMPEMNGFDVLAALKDDPVTRDIPIVLLTALASDEHVWKGWSAGADYYLTKPFDVEDLLGFVSTLDLKPRCP